MSELLPTSRRLPMIILAALLVILSGCLDAGEQSTSLPTTVNISPEATANLPIAPVEGGRAPDFTLTDLDGNEMMLSDLRGQPVLLNFWATW